MTDKKTKEEIGRQLQRLLTKLEDEDVDILLNLSIQTCIESVHEGVLGNPNPIYAEIKEIFDSQRVESCYFCNDQIDPNAEEFNLDRSICMFCQLKMANVLTAIGVDHTKVMPMVGPRTKQKTRIQQIRVAYKQQH